MASTVRLSRLDCLEQNLLRRRLGMVERTGASMKSPFEQMMDGLNDVEAYLAARARRIQGTCAAGS